MHPSGMPGTSLGISAGPSYTFRWLVTDFIARDWSSHYLELSCWTSPRLLSDSGKGKEVVRKFRMHGKPSLCKFEARTILLVNSLSNRNFWITKHLLSLK